MLRFRDYTTLLEGKADDLRQEFQAMPSHSHLVDLDNPTLVKFGQGLKKMSDVPQNIDDVRQTLDAFNKHGSKLAGNLKDFSQHPSFAHVQQALQPHIEKAAMKAQKKQTGMAGEETIHDDGQGTVVKEIHTPEAASQPKYCDTTGWCVSRQGETGRAHFYSYQRGVGTGKNGTARMFVIHTPDNKIHAYHEGESGIVRNSRDHAIQIPDFIDDYPQLSTVKELKSTKYGNLFHPPKVSTPEDVTELLKPLDIQRDDPEYFDRHITHNLNRVKVFKNPKSAIRPEHVDMVLDDPSSGDYLKEAALLHPTAVEPHHIDKILNNPNTVYSLVRNVLGRSTAVEPRHIDRLLDDPNPNNGLISTALEHPTAVLDRHLDKIISSFTHKQFTEGKTNPYSTDLVRKAYKKKQQNDDHFYDKILDNPNSNNVELLGPPLHDSNFIEPRHIDKITNSTSIPDSIKKVLLNFTNLKAHNNV